MSVNIKEMEKELTQLSEEELKRLSSLISREKRRRRCMEGIHASCYVPKKNEAVLPVLLPSAKTHARIDYLLGIASHPEEFLWLHKLIDSFSRVYGPKHRRILHDWNSAMTIWFLFGPRAALLPHMRRFLGFGAEEN
ncbi:hypothetical protein DRP04_10795 [Archaeoglobales archaeon]|nr:MAG: hypothetical protein DRP04_10795 [Archaeoglobales archaeon]